MRGLSSVPQPTDINLNDVSKLTKSFKYVQFLFKVKMRVLN